MTKTILLGKEEIKYLTNLLNQQILDRKGEYYYLIYNIQTKLNLYPRKEPWGCRACGKTFVVTVTKVGNKKVFRLPSCRKKCRKLLQSLELEKIPKPFNCRKCKRKFIKKLRNWYYSIDTERKTKKAFCYKCWLNPDID